MYKTLIIIPTYNEKDNIDVIYKAISKLYPNFHVLFIDDKSLDGTLNKLNFLKKNNKNIFIIKRKKKLGIGSAHKKGILWGYKNKYNYIITMDADGTHNPIYITKMLKNIGIMTKIYKKHYLSENVYDFFKEMYVECCEIMAIITPNICKSLGIEDVREEISDMDQMELIL